MDNLKKIGLYAAVNFLGFTSMSLNFLLAMQLGVFDDQGDQGLLVLRDTFFNNTTAIWLVCAVFSLAYFFVEGKARFAFLWSAAIVPFLYGLSILFH